MVHIIVVLKVKHPSVRGKKASNLFSKTQGKIRLLMFQIHLCPISGLFGFFPFGILRTKFHL